jgi:hypothetical protein
MKRVARSSRGRPIQRPIEQLVRLSGSCICFAITETAAIASSRVRRTSVVSCGQAEFYSGTTG